MSALNPTGPTPYSVRTYRKRPLEIQAVKFGGQMIVARWCSGKFWPSTKVGSNDSYIVIPTLEGKTICHYGDWVIKGIRGEFYACAPDIFEATYELVD
jgi:hypothetical protein